MTWKSSNTKVATVSSSGKVTAKGIGKCTITATCNKKTYKCSIEVVYRECDFIAYIDDYYTRDNYFTMYVENHGDKPLTIYSSGAKACEYNYKSYDRNLYLAGKKNVVIPAGKSKMLKFMVKGSTTWYDYKDFWLEYYFNFDGKKYGATAYADDGDDSSYKKRQ